MIKKLAFLIPILFLCSPSAWAFTQLQINNNTGVTLSLGSSVGLHHLLLLQLTTIGAASSVTSITDSANTWVQATGALPANNTNLNERPDTWYVCSSAAGTLSATMNVSGASAEVYTLTEWSGQSPTCFENANSGQGSSATPSVNVTAAASGNLVVGIMVSTSSPTVGAGFTFFAGNPQADNFFESAEFNSSAGSGTVNVPYVGGSQYAISAASFKPAGPVVRKRAQVINQ